MPKVIFKFDKEKDLWNHWHKSNWKSSWANFQVPPKIKEICEGKKFEECQANLTNHLAKLQNSEIIEVHLKSVEKSWKIIEKEFFKRMDNLMNNKFDKNIFAYLTTVGVCPYDPNEPSFMFSLFYSLPKSLQTCGHEIMHIYFHKFYWKNIEEQIGKEKTGDLKEALTVLLNLEFKDLWFAEDYGYDPHKELRKFIEEKWKENKDFDILMEKCVEHLK
ncbi:MAG: hypothetical protein AABX88_00420 [Nanoarchaeota archaeon]